MVPRDGDRRQRNGMEKKGEKEEQGSESVKVHPKGCGWGEAIHRIWHV